MKITTLIENEAPASCPDLVSEWGLSLHIEFGGRSILFDTGKSGAFADNAKRLDIDIGSVEAAALSHHHFDHGGGLKRFLEINSRANVYLGKSPQGDCQIKILKFFRKYIGLDKSLMREYPDRFVVVGEPAEILPHVFVFPEIRRRYPEPAGNRRLYVSKSDGEMVHDDFSHEMVMAIEDHDGLVIFTGCSHNGLLNMVDTVSREFEGVPVKAVIGGFHLISSPLFNSMAGDRREVEELGGSVLSYPVEMTYTGHCTGAKAFDVLKSVMGDRLTDIRTGTCFEV
ncbi:7, 8-dihydropterin-6-yl-methyl-4-(Beta-D-ribofuranosyl)aminobenzene 5'-phosphate synthase [Candidatus Desulfarcum epimagneticum]|uniref:7, 8-dihydropterin-6-yl-methyl-4-(Beta-D-ribofuranosyl)aminobenzene 5'-phosphate synthase n=1 Tax=uncultured Desulfobacteraceae bacterium TaxID=218296 RepID=A0A484HGA3_9BACT|nr:7, 8-dihydropterin-6-yl-methyl-4-(Beta-D-ribofuranosyl)aminobenzene 5'-phosphate synthase [uncultured Desulfobacteraceae bacterium]